MRSLSTTLLFAVVLAGSLGAKKPRTEHTITREERPRSLIGCPEGTVEIGARPPQAFEMWCSRNDAAGRPQRHGPSWSWWPDGRLRATGPFLDGKRTGHWWFWTADGALEQEGDFRDDLEDGYWIVYRPDGAVSAEGPMRTGGRDGVWVTYDDGAGRPQEGLWVGGQKEGVWVEYTADDRPLRERVFRHGRLISQREL